MTGSQGVSSDSLSGYTFGQYLIGEEIGRGGMATVYRAEQTSIGRTVAIKVMPHHFLHDPSFLERFRREVQVIARLQHPRILPIYDYGQYEGMPYIVMAYMPGGTLAGRIANGPMALDLIVKIVDQVAEALDHAHANGVIHRDFKPSNVLLDANDNAHLADFGIAKINEATMELTGSAIVGTPAYMAPEMSDRGEVTPAVDVYALGVTLYQMLTGQYPFQGETPIRVLLAHATEPVPDVREIRPELPESVAEVVRRAMAKDPADRYQSASELAEALRSAAAGEPGRPAAPPAAHDDMIMTMPVPEAVKPPTKTPVAEPTPMEPHLPEAAPAPEKKERKGCGKTLLWIALAVVVLGGACLVGALMLGWLGGAASTPTPTPSPPTAVPVLPTPEVAGIEVYNAGQDVICYLYISPTDSEEWGDDWLGDDRVLGAGESVTITDIGPGTYDLRADDCDDQPLMREYAVKLGESLYVWEVVKSDLATLVIVNNSSASICRFYISSSSEEGWGPDQLEGATIPPGADHRITNIPPDLYDLLAETCDGQSVEDYGIEIMTLFTWTITD